MDWNNSDIYSEITFFRFILFQSGKTWSFYDSCNCNELNKYRSNSLYEICFHTHLAFNVNNYAKYMGFNKYHIPNCIVCKNYVTSYNNSGKICKLYKVLQIEKSYNFDTSRAKECQYFTFNQEEYNREAQNIGTIQYDEFLK